MEVFHLDAVAKRPEGRAGRYAEFVRVPPMSLGVYVLPVGGEDLQGPHHEDEVYHVVRGRARFTSGGRTVDAVPGTLLFVPAEERHRFHDVEEELVVLVFFAPAETMPSLA